MIANGCRPFSLALALLLFLVGACGCSTFEGGRGTPRRGLAAHQGGGGSMSIGVPPTPEGLAFLLAVIAIKELGEEIGEEMDDLDATVARPFPEVREAAELALFDLGYDDIEPKDKNASAKIWGWNVHDEGVFIKLVATGKDDMETRVSIYAGDDHALTERVLETLYLNLGMAPPDSGKGEEEEAPVPMSKERAPRT